MVTIWVYPTEEGLPPRALLTQVEGGENGSEAMQAVAVWENDSWSVDGEALPDELGEAITEHARELGVEEFQE